MIDGWARRAAHDAVPRAGTAVSTQPRGPDRAAPLLTDLTGPPASSLYSFAVGLLAGGLLVLARPRSVDHPAVTDRVGPGQ